jgi:hypothetical protein
MAGRRDAGSAAADVSARLGLTAFAAGVLTLGYAIGNNRHEAANDTDPEAIRAFALR